MITVFYLIAQLFFFIAVAPFLSGVITRIKNNIRMRRGQSILQPYYNLAKLFSKGETVSDTSSWIFRITPFIVIVSSLTAAVLIPVSIVPFQGSRLGDFLVIIFVLALGRFFLALAALDTGSAFGGMGSSREMFISSLVEPALCLVIFSLSLQSGSTDLSALTRMQPVSLASIVAALAMFLLTLAETSRVPVDNQETHLELTMVHEAMVLEYSGRSLALLEMAAYIKQMVWFFLIAQIIFPMPVLDTVTVEQAVFWLSWYVARITIIVVAVALVEVSVAKMRLFRVTDFLGFAFVLGIIASLCALVGV